MKTQDDRAGTTAKPVAQGNVPVPQGMKTPEDLAHAVEALEHLAQGNVPVPQGMKTVASYAAWAALYRLRETSPFRRG